MQLKPQRYVIQTLLSIYMASSCMVPAPVARVRLAVGIKTSEGVVTVTKMELVRVKERLDSMEEEAVDRIRQSNEWYRNLQVGIYHIVL